MLTTIERVNILDQADKLSEMIIQSEIAEHYRFHYRKLQEDKQTKEKIAAFTKMKEQYDDVQRFGRYHPDYKQIMLETRQKKREMDMDDNVVNFRKAEKELQSLLDEISVLIGRAVSNDIRVAPGNLFFDIGSSCGGCGTGSGCGCST